MARVVTKGFDSASATPVHAAVDSSGGPLSAGGPSWALGMVTRLGAIVVCLLLSGACALAAPPGDQAMDDAVKAWAGTLPDGTGGAPLPAPDLVLFLERDGTLHPLTSDPVCSRSGMRVRLYVDAEVPGKAVWQAFYPLMGCASVDLAGGPDGAHGLTFDQRTEAQTAGFWPLRIVLFEEGVAIGRQPWPLIHAPAPSGPARARLLAGMMDADRALHGATVDVAPSVADTVLYAEIFGTLLAAQTRGYVVPHHSGGRSTGRFSPPKPSLPAALAAPEVPTRVRIDPLGTFWLEGASAPSLSAADVAVFVEVARGDSAVVVAIRRAGAPVVLGARPAADPSAGDPSAADPVAADPVAADPVRGWIFGVPVVPAPAGWTVPASVPPVEGVWSPYIQRSETG